MMMTGMVLKNLLFLAVMMTTMTSFLQNTKCTNNIKAAKTKLAVSFLFCKISAYNVLCSYFPDQVQGFNNNNNAD